MKLVMTVVYEYDADPENYGTNDPVEMAKIDAPNWFSALDFAFQEGVPISVEIRAK